MVFHARGLINSRVIQHNLDWVWPYWVERQFDPHDISFVPRSFSITHINLTHRNWTAVGLPDFAELPLVDPRGLVTPFFDGWSLDAWVGARDGRLLVPSRAENADQRLSWEGGLAVSTHVKNNGLSLASRTDVVEHEGVPTLRWKLAALADAPGWIAVSLRP